MISSPQKTVHPDGGRRPRPDVPAHDRVLVGADGTAADRLLEHVGGLSVSDRAGGNLLHPVAQCKEVRIGRRIQVFFVRTLDCP